METFGISSPIPSSMGVGMTIAMGVLNREAAGLVVTDSREADEESMTLNDGVLKSIRVNGHCALAFSGDAVAANRVAAYIYKAGPAEIRMVQAIDNGSRCVLQTIEDEGLEVGQCPHVIAHWLNGRFIELMKSVYQGEARLPRVNAILVGKEDGHNHMWSWAWQDKFLGKSWRDEAVKVHCSVFGPGKPDGVLEKLKDPAISLEERIRAVAEMYHAICPCGVNLDLKMRRASQDFKLESLDALSANNSQAQDQRGLHHVDG